MYTLRNYAGQPLEWVQPNAFQDFFTLQVNGETLATARWEGKWTKNLVVGETESEQWLLKSTNILSEQVNIYPGEARDSLKAVLPLASFEFHYRKERLELLFIDGRSFTWTWKRSATPTLTCTLPNGQKALSVQTRRRRPLVHNLKELVLEIDQEARDLPETSLLAFVGLYLGRLILVCAENDLKHRPLAWIELIFGLLELLNFFG